MWVIILQGAFLGPSAVRGGNVSNPAAVAGDKGSSRTKVAGGSSADSNATIKIEHFDARFLAEGSSPSWSPGGGSVVYCHGDELKILDIERRSTRILAPSGRSPAWSPGDGRYIAYVRARDGKEEICVCEAAGGPSQRLAGGKDPRWSVDGRILYFYSTEKPQWFAIGIAPRRAAVAVAPPEGLFSDAGIASQDGIRVARQVGDRLQVVDRRTGKFAREWPVATTVHEMPVWSRDGRYLAFAGYRCASGVILGVLDVETNLLLRVGDSQFGSPRWSPNGSELAFVVRRQGRAEIWSIAMGDLKRLQPLAPACECPGFPQAAAELIGPWQMPFGNLVPIDLSRHYNSDKAGTGDGNQLELAAGIRLLAGVEFQIGSRMIQLQGPSVPTMPPSVQGIPVHRRVVRLYFLHATQNAMKNHGVGEGDLIAEYRVRYADGERETIPVVVGQDVRDWWNKDHEPVSRGQIAWVGSNERVLKSDCYVRLYLSTWKNPHPEKSVESIDYVSMKTNAVPFCVAMTAEEPRSVSGERQAWGREANRVSDNR